MIATRLRDDHGHGPGDNEVVRNSSSQRRALGEGHVGDASNALGHLAAFCLGKLGKGGAAGKDAAGREGAVGGAGARGGIGLDAKVGADGEDAALASALAGGAAGSVAACPFGGAARLHGELGKGFNLEVGALGAGLDEGGGEGEDGAGPEGRVKGLGHGDLLGEDADGGLVAGLDGEDGAGGAEDGLVGEQRCGAEVRRDANVLEHGGRLDHGGGVGEAKLVLARLHGLHAALRERRLQQADVLGLGLANLLQVRNGLLVETERGKVGGRELGEALAVKGLFEVFQGQSAM